MSRPGDAFPIFERPVYVPDDTAQAFHASPALVRGIMGPVGTGKSSTCINELLMLALEQMPGVDGVRRTRGAAIRNTYGELKTTTIKSWQDWVPEAICPFVYDSPIRATMKVRVRHQGKLSPVELEMFFVSMDKPKDVRKLKSLDLTVAWLNEASELDKGVLDKAIERIGRYPPKFLGGGRRYTVIMDTNPMDEDHWWHRLAEIEKPTGFQFFRQPAPLIKIGKGAKARYLPNAAAGYTHVQAKGIEYWLDLIPGKAESYINTMVLGQYGSNIDGKPIYEEFNSDVHEASEPIRPLRGVPLVIGIDGGLTPAALITQLTPSGRLVALDEVVATRAGMKQFVGAQLWPFLRNRYPRMDYDIVFDPTLETPDNSDIESSPAKVLDAAGLPGVGAATNDWETRRDALAGYMLRMVDGGPGLLVSPTCRVFLAGLRGKYRYKRMEVGVSGGMPIYSDKPVKDFYSHIQDAGQYAAMHASGAHLSHQQLRSIVADLNAQLQSNAGGWT